MRIPKGAIVYCEDPDCGHSIEEHANRKAAIRVVLDPTCGGEGGEVTPIPVEITNPAPVVDNEFYCNEDTDTWWEKTTVFPINSDGTVGTPSVISENDTGISCSDPKPSATDIEKIDYCNPDTNTMWVKVCKYVTDADDVTTEVLLSETDTGVPCTASAFKIYEDALCETLADGTQVKFVRIKSLDASTGVVSVVGDYLPDLTPYVVVDEANVGECDCTGDGEVEEPVCTVFREQELCETLGDGSIVTFIRITAVQSDGTSTVIANITPDNQPYTVVDETAVGECVEEPVDEISLQIDVECNEQSGNYDYITTTITNGIAGTPAHVDSGIACTADAPVPEKDYVIRTECDPVTNTIHETLIALNTSDDTETVLTSVDTLRECNPDTSTIQCWKDKFIEGGLDNTFTRFTHTNQLFTVTFDNGDVDTFTVASATGWTDQVNQMATGLDSIMPWAQTVDPFCTFGCGGLPSPFVQLNKMVARYVGFRVCPGDKVPVSVEYTSDQVTKPKQLVIQYVETDTIYIDRCISCDGVEEWKVDGQPYTPVCAIPCGDQFANTPLSKCEITYQDGCDNVNSTDQTDFVTIVRAITDCGDGPEVSYLQEDADGALIDYTLVGDFVDCDTGEIVGEPKSDTHENCDGTQVEVTNTKDAALAETIIDCECTEDLGFVNKSQIYTEGQGDGIWDTGVYGTVPVGTQAYNYGVGITGYAPGSSYLWELGDNVNWVAFSGIVGNPDGTINCLNQETANQTGVSASLPDERDLETYARVTITTPCGGVTQMVFLLQNTYTGPDVGAWYNTTHNPQISLVSTTVITQPGCNKAVQTKGCLDQAILDAILANTAAVQANATAISDLALSINVLIGDPDTAECPCSSGDSLGDPLGDQTICASRKMGADFTSGAAGSATHTLDSLYDTNGAVDAWVGTFTVVDSANVTHTFTNGQTITGLASGSVTSVSFTGQVEWSDGGTTYRCPVTDKLISAGFVVL